MKMTITRWDTGATIYEAEAFTASGPSGVPLLLKPPAEQFIRYFDAIFAGGRD